MLIEKSSVSRTHTYGEVYIVQTRLNLYDTRCAIIISSDIDHDPPTVSCFQTLRTFVHFCCTLLRPELFKKHLEYNVFAFSNV